MYKTMKCYKNVVLAEIGNGNLLHVNGSFYLTIVATLDEIERGNEALAAWQVERLYQVQVAGAGIPTPYFDWRSEPKTVSFEELIFHNGVCIGIFHEGLVFLFDDEATHRQEKFIGEFVTGPDRTVDVYDRYQIKRKTTR